MKQLLVIKVAVLAVAALLVISFSSCSNANASGKRVPTKDSTVIKSMHKIKTRDTHGIVSVTTIDTMFHVDDILMPAEGQPAGNYRVIIAE